MKKKPHIQLICIGTELLIGKVNTHTAHLGQQLSGLGFPLQQSHTVGDDPKSMADVFSSVIRRADVVISIGGLGPTFDDITREVWAKTVGRRLALNGRLVEEIKEKFKGRGIKMPPQNRRQGFILKGAHVIPNHNGTAPGQFLKLGKKILILLPGPGRELFPMLDEYVKPKLIEMFRRPYTQQKNFQIFGVPESVIDEKVRPLVSKYAKMKNGKITYGILASDFIITVKFRVEGQDYGQVNKVASLLAQKFRAKLGKQIFGEDDATLSQSVGDLLQKNNKTVAVAESCTGGLLSKLITDRPGSSAYYKEGLVTYSNASKITRLGVSFKAIKKFGAVSDPTAREMAQNIRKKTHSDYGLSITGIAGPEGGTLQKPVGLVFIGLASRKRVFVKKYQFPGQRSGIRTRSAYMALNLLRRELG